MKKLFVLLILLSSFMFSFTVTKGHEWEKDMVVDDLNPISNPEVWINGDSSMHYAASTINVESINKDDTFTVEIHAKSIDDGFPSDAFNEPDMDYALYYGYSTSDTFNVVDSDGNSSTEYETKKFTKRGQIKKSPTTILSITKSSTGSGYVWFSFIWIARTGNQLAVKQKKADIEVNIN